MIARSTQTDPLSPHRGEVKTDRRRGRGGRETERERERDINIYIYAVRLLSGPSLGVFGSYYLVQVGFLEVIIWSKFVFLAYKNSGFKRFVLHTQLSFCVFFLFPIFLAIF